MDDLENIVLLSTDALRADHLSMYGHYRETSPKLNELAQNSIQFENAYSASSHTREAVPSMLTGRHPDEATDLKYHLATETIMSVLSKAGYTTAGFHSNPFISRAYGFDRGFDTFDDDLHLGQHKPIALAQRALDKIRNRHYARADEINKRSLNWIDSLDDEPFVLWNHYMDTHGPYEPPSEFKTLYRNQVVSNNKAQSLYQRAIEEPESITDTEQQLLIDYYDAEIRYNDGKIGEFLDALRSRNLLEQSLVIFTADHGDAFGERGYYEHPRYVHDELVHVPLLVRMPGGKTSTVQAPVSTLDIAPTVLSAVGKTDETLPGYDLLEVTNNPASFEDRVIFSSARGENDDAHLRRFSARSSTATWYATYDYDDKELVTEKDMNNPPEVLHEHIAERVSDVEISDTDDNGASDEELQRRLAALGYK